VHTHWLASRLSFARCGGFVALTCWLLNARHLSLWRLAARRIV
jgi:hypothetical protein